MKEETFKILSLKDIAQILKLTKQLNQSISNSELENRQNQMFEFDNYKCFGFFENDELIGVASGWMTIRLYSDKQLEIDNVIIDNSIQSNGYGSKFIAQIESWALTNKCKTVELNTYAQNTRSHKFYYNHGYSILGFHFQKQLSK